MVKRFFRLSIDSIILQIFTILFIGGCVYFAVLSTKEIVGELDKGTSEVLEIIVTIVYYLGILLFVYVELTFLVGNISLGLEAISNNGDIKFGREKIQYPTYIKYCDINDIAIIALRKNSKGENVSLSRPIPYLILTSKQGKKFRFALHLMSKRNVESLLLNLLNKCKENNSIVFDIDKLMKDFSEARFVVKEK